MFNAACIAQSTLAILNRVTIKNDLLPYLMGECLLSLLQKVTLVIYTMRAISTRIYFFKFYENSKFRFGFESLTGITVNDIKIGDFFCFLKFR